jgi:hypothetical protein
MVAATSVVMPAFSHGKITGARELLSGRLSGRGTLLPVCSSS